MTEKDQKELYNNPSASQDRNKDKPLAVTPEKTSFEQSQEAAYHGELKN
jgi:hypothetical protein